jgi:hypothetical protein
MRCCCQTISSDSSQPFRRALSLTGRGNRPSAIKTSICVRRRPQNCGRSVSRMIRLDAALEGGSNAARTRELNPRRNPRGGANAPATERPDPDYSDRTQRNRRRSVPLPEDWRLGPPEMEAAQSLTDWDPERVQTEFDQFLDWHRAHRPFSYNWLAAWTSWCRRDSGRGQRQSAPLTGVRSAVLELRDWLDEKKHTDG